MIGEYEWRILGYYIRNGNSSGLELMNRLWFSGLARSVYDIVMRARGKASIAYVLEMCADELHPDEVQEVRTKLLVSGGEKPEEIVAMMHAISYRYASRTIQRAIRRAEFRLGDNDPPFRIKSDLLTELESAYELAPNKSIEEHMRKMKESAPRYITLPGPKFQSAGIDVLFLGNIMTMGGESGGFKTTGAVNFLKWLLRANPDLYALYFSKEQPAAEISQKFITLETPEYITYSDVLRKFNASYPDFCEMCLNEMSTAEYQRRLQIIDPTEFASPEDIGQILRSYAVGKKEVVWVVDYLTLLHFPGKDNQTVNISEGLKVLKTLAHQTGSLGILISQLQKGWNVDPRTKHEDHFVFPNRSNLLWSGELINLSAYIFLIKRLAESQGQGQHTMTDYLAWRVEKVRFADANTIITWRVRADQQQLRAPDQNEYIQINALLKSLTL